MIAVGVPSWGTDLRALRRYWAAADALTYAFDAAAHHPSWLAKRAVAVDHLSDGRLDLRLAVGAGDAATAAEWEQHGIAYPDGAEFGRLSAAARRGL